MSKLNLLPSSLNSKDNADVIIYHEEGVKENISKSNELYLNVDFDEVRKKRELNEESIKENSLTYGNISDDKLIATENELFGEEMKAKAEEIKKLGPMGYNAHRVAFGRRNRDTLLESNLEPNPFTTIIQQDLVQKNSIRDFGQTYKEAYEEEKIDGLNLNNLTFKNSKVSEKKKIKFEDVLEMAGRDLYGLIGGRMRESVNDIVEQHKKEYIENNVNSVSAHDNPSGRYRGGFERTQFLTQAQNNKQTLNNDVVIDKKRRLNIDSYYSSYGNTKNNTEIDKDTAYERTDQEKKNI